MDQWNSSSTGFVGLSSIDLHHSADTISSMNLIAAIRIIRIRVT
jgi:hypothetical protein